MTDLKLVSPVGAQEPPHTLEEKTLTRVDSVPSDRALGSTASSIEVKCPCGLGDEPWHWPRGGVCVVGMDKALGK